MQFKVTLDAFFSEESRKWSKKGAQIFADKELQWKIQKKRKKPNIICDHAKALCVFDMIWSYRLGHKDELPQF